MYLLYTIAAIIEYTDILQYHVIIMIVTVITIIIERFVSKHCARARHNYIRSSFFMSKTIVRQ